MARPLQAWGVKAGTYWTALKKAASDFSNDAAMTHAAALSFYSALSLAPMLLLFLTAAGTLGESWQASLVSAITNVVGPQAGDAIRTVTDNADAPTLTSLSGVIGLATLLYSASGFFAALQTALNHIWDVQAKPGAGVWGWLRKRVLSVGMIFTLLLILLMSLVASSVLLTVANTAEQQVPVPGGDVLATVVQVIVSLVVFFLLFALLFKFVPDVKIAWRDVLLGAGITSVLFVIGKFAIGFYMGTSGTGSAYGAAGSLIALLVWVYYSVVIVFFGAEMTQALVRVDGRRIEPDEHAEYEPDAKVA